MSDDTWSMLVVSCQQAAVELVSDVLWQRGVVAVEERTSSVDHLCELWTSVGDDPHSVTDVLAECEGVIGVRVESVSRRIADTWREFATPIVVTEEVRIVPSWLDMSLGAEDVLVDPFDTFGLGNHPTTIGALRLLLGLGVRDGTMLDVGTGSGILAITMAKCRGFDVVGFDISSSSRKVVAHNAALNNVAVTVVDGFASVNDSFDVVAANILAPVLRELATEIAARVREGGVIVLAGMRTEQVHSVVEVFGGYGIVESVDIDGWSSVVLRRVS